MKLKKCLVCGKLIKTGSVCSDKCGSILNPKNGRNFIKVI